MTKEVTSQETTPPCISIIIPVHNAEKTLGKCLSAVFNSTFQKFEVIIVDDASNDASLRIASSFPCSIIELNINMGASAARNRGARNARGAFLLFIDSDVVIQRNTVQLFVDSLKNYSAVFGIYSQNPGVDDLLSLYQNFYAHKSIKETKELTSMFYSYCAAIKKELFHTAGEYDESWTRATFEDVEFGLRVVEKGHRIYLNKHIEVVHYNYYTMKRFINNYFYKSIDLCEFMLSKKKVTLNNEGWTNYKNIISLVSGILSISLLFFLLKSTWFVLPQLFSLVLFLGLNVDFYRFILKEKPTGLFTAILLNLMVQIVSAAGITVGIIKYLNKKV